jgi:predicted GH43/DUF377 family glycosyl hydrolase
MARQSLIVALLVLLSPSAWTQITWKRSEANPILPVSAQPLCYAIEPSVLYDSVNQAYRMWYCSYDCGGALTISTAVSSDGETWIPYGGNPVLTPGISGSWDSQTIWAAEVVKVYGMYYMFYSGWNGQHIQIGLAKSEDGLAWQKDYSNPVLGVGSANAWDRDHVTYARVLYEENRFMLWYDGRSGQAISTGMATSTDGRTWTKHPSNPVLTPAASGQWDDRWRAPGAIVREGSRYLMLYVGRGYSQQIPQYGLAVSDDGAAWTIPHSQPVFSPGPQGQWDDYQLGGGTLRRIGSYLVLWYGANNTSSGRWKVGMTSAHREDFTTPRPHQRVEMNPSNIVLEAVHPNPVRTSTRVSFRLSQPLSVQGALFNSIGQEISTLIDGPQEAGEHVIDIDVRSLASGMYWLRMRAGLECRAQRFFIVR